MPNGKNHSNLQLLLPWLFAAALIAAVPLSAYPIASAVQYGRLPAGAMAPYQAATIMLAGAPLDAPWVGWLDGCCDHADARFAAPLGVTFME